MNQDPRNPAWAHHPLEFRKYRGNVKKVLKSSHGRNYVKGVSLKWQYTHISTYEGHAST
jgi:hypothetical protein